MYDKFIYHYDSPKTLDNLVVSPFILEILFEVFC